MATPDFDTLKHLMTKDFKVFHIISLGTGRSGLILILQSLVDTSTADDAHLNTGVCPPWCRREGAWAWRNPRHLHPALGPPLWRRGKSEIFPPLEGGESSNSQL